MNQKTYVLYRAATVTLLLSVIIFSGCTRRNKKPNFERDLQLGKATGVVTLDGQPLPGASVVFERMEGTPRRRSTGITDEDGRYRMAYSRGGMGVLPGNSIVRIRASAPTNGEEEAEREPSSRDQIPAKYNSRSKVVVTVEPFGNHEFDFALESK